MPTTVLYLADADAAVRAALAFSLGLEGFQVETFACGAELLACLPLAAEGCVVLDARLADGDGLALLAALRMRAVTLLAILTASHPPRALRETASAAGAAIVEKPLIGDGLAAAIRQALGQARLAA